MNKGPFRVFSFLVAGYAISSFGNFLDMVALNLFVYAVTGSPFQTGLFMAIRLAASFFTGLAAGNLVSRYNRRVLMVGSDLTQMLSLVGLVFMPAPLQIAMIYVLALVTGVCGTLSGVSLRSSIPEMIGQEQRVRANGLLVTWRSVAMILGFASASVIIAWWGYKTAFLFDAATFIISACILAWLPLSLGGSLSDEAASSEGRQAETSPEAGGSRRKMFASLRVMPVLIAMIFIRGLDAFGSASHNVAIPIYSTLIDPRHPADFMGRFWTAWAIGSLLSYYGLSRLLKHISREWSERAFALGTCLMSICFILVFVNLPAFIMLIVAVGAGVADGFTEITYTSRLQATSDKQRGFLFGLSASVESSGLGIGMIISSVLLETLAPLKVVALLHGIAIGLALLFLLLIFVMHGRNEGRVDIPVTAPAADTLSLVQHVDADEIAHGDNH